MSKKNKIAIAVAVTLGLLIITLSILTYQRHRRQKGVTFNVGAILPLTGPAASFGRSSQNAITLAQDDLKSLRPGFSLSVHFEDSAGDPKTALSGFERLHRIEGTKVFLSSVSGVTLALLPVVRRDGLLLFANAAHPDITKGGGNVFRYSNTVDSEAKVIAAFFPKIAVRRVYCLASNDDYGKSYVSELQQLAAVAPSNFQLVGSDLYSPTTTDFRTILAKAKESSPDAFVVVGFGRALGLLVRQLRETGFSGPFIASLGFVVTPEAVESAGEGMRGGYFLNYEALNDPRVRALRQRYRDRFGDDPSPSIILDYSLMFVVADAVAVAGPDPTALAGYLNQVKTYETPIGRLISSGERNIVAPVRVQTVPSAGPIDLWSEK